MRDFFKYLVLGLLGLSLSLALPQIPVNWAALVLTQTYLAGVRRFSPWMVLLLLAWAYSAFSLSSALVFAVPWALAWLIGLGLRRSFHWEGPEERALVLALLSVLPITAGAWLALGPRGPWLLDWRDWFAGLTTFGVGFFGAPLLSLLGLRLRRRLSAFLPRRSQVDLSRADWLSGRDSRLSRKPFGLEKGI
ncbi:MAG TPA: hypothetical protein VJR29_00530 [bacterium]|nr:hypothetical protein [bacterium]